MLRSQTVLTIHDLATQGKSVPEIAQELDISRTMVRKYLTHPEAVLRQPRPPRPSKLDPYKEQIKKWVTEDHCTKTNSRSPGFLPHRPDRHMREEIERISHA